VSVPRTLRSRTRIDRASNAPGALRPCPSGCTGRNPQWQDRRPARHGLPSPTRRRRRLCRCSP